MKTLLVGSQFNGPDVTPIAFMSQKYVLDYDLLIVELNAVISELNNSLAISAGYGRVNKTEVVLRRLNERTQEINEFYKHGGLVVVIVDTYPIFQCKLQDHHNLASGIFEINLLDLFSLNKLSYTALTGDIVECDSILAKLSEYCLFNYHAFINNYQGKKLLWTRKAKNVVSFACQFEKGIFCCIPGFKFKGNLPTNEKKIVLEEIIEITQTLSQEAFKKEVIAPSWIDDILIGDEEVNLIELNKVKEQISALQNASDILVGTLKKYSEIKSLLYLDGVLLENKVQLIFESIGFIVEKPDGYDVDLIIKSDEFVGVVETKGVKGSGAKANSRQLENWVTNYSIANNDDAKGLLIINAFKNVPLAERTEIAFPPDMVTYSEQRDHCLILTKDLMFMYIDCQKGLIDKTEIVKLVSECSGVFSYQPRFNPFADARVYHPSNQS